MPSGESKTVLASFVSSDDRVQSNEQIGMLISMHVIIGIPAPSA